MPKSFPFLLLCASLMLTGCRIPSPVGEQVPGYLVYLHPEVVSHCGNVTWQDTAFTWASDTALSPGMIAWNYNDKGQRPAQLRERAVILDAGTVMVELARNVLPGPLHSTFTCQNTGEVWQAAFTFPMNGPRAASLFLDLSEEGLQGDWKLIPPPI